jgi:methylenetetrahydrofolate reductase (NADPH)
MSTVPTTPSTPESDTREAVRRLVLAADYELIPLKGLDDKLGALPPATTVTVTSSVKLGLERTLQQSLRAAAAGYHVVPHLPARQVRDEAELRSFVGRIRDAGITDLYVIGGDAPEPLGPYQSAAQLLAVLAGIDHGLQEIGVACYPEGHPSITDEALLAALLEKQPHATYMVSQLCFDGDAVLGWLRGIRRAGVTLPLHLGLAGPLSMLKLAELSVRIGVGASVKYLTKQHGLVGSLLRGSSYKPEDLLLGMGEDLTAPELGIASLHLCTFNQVEATHDWQRRIAGGGLDQR